MSLGSALEEIFNPKRATRKKQAAITKVIDDLRVAIPQGGSIYGYGLVLKDLFARYSRPDSTKDFLCTSLLDVAHTFSELKDEKMENFIRENALNICQMVALRTQLGSKTEERAAELFKKIAESDPSECNRISYYDHAALLARDACVPSHQRSFYCDDQITSKLWKVAIEGIKRNILALPKAAQPTVFRSLESHVYFRSLDELGSELGFSYNHMPANGSAIDIHYTGDMPYLGAHGLSIRLSGLPRASFG